MEKKKRFCGETLCRGFRDFFIKIWKTHISLTGIEFHVESTVLPMEIPLLGEKTIKNYQERGETYRWGIIGKG